MDDEVQGFGSMSILIICNQCLNIASLSLLCHVCFSVICIDPTLSLSLAFSLSICEVLHNSRILLFKSNSLPSTLA